MAVAGSGADADVYISGFSMTTPGSPPNDGLLTPCYWVNGTLHSLSRFSTSYKGLGQSIFLSGEDVYVGGWVTNSASSSIPCYWKNGDRTDITDVLNPSYYNEALSIHVSGTDVYMAGRTHDMSNNMVACYWLNGVRTDLTDVPGDTVSSDTIDIAVHGTDVYIAGVTFNGDSNVPCFWKNGVRTDLSQLYPSLSGVGTTKIFLD
jgi:hypothetical protein